MGAKLTNTEVQERLDKTFAQKVKLVGDYVNRRTSITLKCQECGYQWTTLPTSVLYKNCVHRCPNCGIDKKGEIVKCAYCGKEIYRSPRQLTNSISGLYYCSRECGNRHKNELRIKNGEWDNSTNYRKKAFDNYEHKCVVCGWHEDERILEVHHKDENRNNNNIDNLCILCPICHRKITLGYYKLTDNYMLINN